MEIDLSEKSSPAALLSTLRTLRYLIDRISLQTLKAALPSLIPLFHLALSHKSVDMRKATVFVLVEMHFVFAECEGNEMALLDELTDCQRRLIEVYINRHPKSQRGDANDLAPQSGGMPMRPIQA